MNMDDARKYIAEFDNLLEQFNVGDRVHVIDIVDEDAMHPGWQCAWIDEMDDAVGKDFRIECVYYGGMGIGLDVNGELYFFPPEILRKISRSS
jgi:hypothetical protein